MDDSKNIPHLKSYNNHRCLTKCYPKNKLYMHPVVLGFIKNFDKNTCAINPVYDKKNNSNNIKIYDECRLDDNNTYVIPDDTESLLLKFYFDPYNFLRSIYELYSFDEVIEWSKEMYYLPFNTIKRVHNCAWIAFGLKMEEITDNVVDYYFYILNKYWTKDYLKNIEKDYSFELSTDKSDDNIETIYDELFKSTVTNSFLQDLIKNYIFDYEDSWIFIESHYDNFKKYIYEKFVEKINKNLTD